jgi:hypothetical protein
VQDDPAATPLVLVRRTEAEIDPRGTEQLKPQFEENLQDDGGEFFHETSSARVPC